MTDPAEPKRPAPPPEQTRKWLHGLATRRGIRRAAARRAAEAAEQREGEQ